MALDLMIPGMKPDEALHFEEQLRTEWETNDSAKANYATFGAFKEARWNEEAAKSEADRCYKG